VALTRGARSGRWTRVAREQTFQFDATSQEPSHASGPSGRRAHFESAQARRNAASGGYGVRPLANLLVVLRLVIARHFTSKRPESIGKGGAVAGLHRTRRAQCPRRLRAPSSGGTISPCRANSPSASKGEPHS
jgi:hypothetical protein